MYLRQTDVAMYLEDDDAYPLGMMYLVEGIWVAQAWDFMEFECPNLVEGCVTLRDYASSILQ